MEGYHQYSPVPALPGISEVVQYYLYNQYKSNSCSLSLKNMFSFFKNHYIHEVIASFTEIASLAVMQLSKKVLELFALSKFSETNHSCKLRIGGPQQGITKLI